MRSDTIHMVYLIMDPWLPRPRYIYLAWVVPRSDGSGAIDYINNLPVDIEGDDERTAFFKDTVMCLVMEARTMDDLCRISNHVHVGGYKRQAKTKGVRG